MRLQKFGGLVAFVMVVLFCSTGWAFQNEPQGFRGLTWGTAAEQISSNAGVKLTLDAGKNADSNYAVYTYGDGKQEISGEAITSPIKLYFFKNQLWKVEVPVTGASVNDTLDKFKRLRNAMVLLYGEQNFTYDNFVNNFINRGVLWAGLTTSIKLDTSYYANLAEAKQNLTIILESGKLATEMRTYEAQKLKAQAASGW